MQSSIDSRYSLSAQQQHYYILRFRGMAITPTPSQPWQSKRTRLTSLYKRAGQLLWAEGTPVRHMPGCRNAVRVHTSHCSWAYPGLFSCGNRRPVLPRPPPLPPPSLQ